jgi:excisionase family DNA binding protein
VNRSHLSVSDVAEQTGRDRRTITRLITDGYLKAEKYNGRWEIPATELERLPQLSAKRRYVRPHAGLFTPGWKQRLVKSDDRA